MNRIELIAVAASRSDSLGLNKDIEKYNFLKGEIFEISKQLEKKSIHARECLMNESMRPSLDNTEIVSISHKLACKQTQMAEILFDIGAKLESLGCQTDW